MTTLIPALLALALGWLPSVDQGVDPGVDPRGSGTWPLHPQPEVVSGFDPPDSAYGAGHRGVDLAGGPGQGVRAALGGKVTFAGRLAGRGVVVVSHGGTRTTYEPVRASVQVGDRVPNGAPIGALELPASHCFPRACLHWGWLRGETYLDPLELVGAGPVRLKPWAGLPAGRAGVVAHPGVGPDVGAAVAAHLVPAPLVPVTRAAVRAAETVRLAGEPAGRPCGASRC